MQQPLGRAEPPASGPVRACPLLSCGKKKGCRRKKCSKWKGGDCRCGRD
ncbi:MAG: hypothetical protein VKN17_03070 [Cyanobacteriota bacterium]|nr:hypothetical protein [Synechococcus sp. FGCU3]MEB3104743.1 hypothetical protein [Cyanobacteriota bacterium]